MLQKLVSVSNDELHGKNPKDAASILQWIEFAENEILPASCTWVFPCLGAMQFNKQVGGLPYVLSHF